MKAEHVCAILGLAFVICMFGGCLETLITEPDVTPIDPIHEVEPELVEPEPEPEPEPTPTEVIPATRRTPPVSPPAEKVIGERTKREIAVATLEDGKVWISVKSFVYGIHWVDKDGKVNQVILER